MAEKKDAIALLAHSASGKSALLLFLGIDRYYHDMDVFMQRNKALSPLNALRAMLPECRGMVCIRNDADFLRQLKKARDRGEFSGVEFVYLKRPQCVVYKNFCGANADGLRHRSMAEVDHARLYTRAEVLFKALADRVIEYSGQSLNEMGILFGDVGREALGPDWDLGHLHPLVSKSRLSPRREGSRYLWNLDLPRPVPRAGESVENLIAGWVFHRDGLDAGPVELALRVNTLKKQFALNELRKDVLSMLQGRGRLSTAEVATLPVLGFKINVQEAFGIPLTAPVVWELGFVHGRQTTWVSSVTAGP